MSATTSNPCKDSSLYRSLAGALQYLTFTRPDISYVVQHICLFMHNPMEDHMNAIRRILRYIQGTSQYGLHLPLFHIHMLIGVGAPTPDVLLLATASFLEIT